MAEPLEKKEVRSTVVSFDQAQTGDVTTGDIVGRDKITNNYTTAAPASRGRERGRQLLDLVVPYSACLGLLAGFLPGVAWGPIGIALIGVSLLGIAAHGVLAARNGTSIQRALGVAIIWSVAMYLLFFWLMRGVFFLATQPGFLRLQ